MSEIRWFGPYTGNDRFADDTTVADMVRLRKENQELKDYLEHLERYITYLEAGIIDVELSETFGRRLNVTRSGGLS